jgi:lysophospholipase L1-like esterase
MTQPFVDYAFLAGDGTGIPLGSTIKIMPLGDSITQGQNTSYGSYRKQLYSLLTARGVAVDFVGPLSDGTFADPDHAGFTGEGINSIWGRVLAGILTTYTPDLILLLIGTNDVWHGSGDIPLALSIYNSLLAPAYRRGGSNDSCKCKCI